MQSLTLPPDRKWLFASDFILLSWRPCWCLTVMQKSLSSKVWFFSYLPLKFAILRFWSTLKGHSTKSIVVKYFKRKDFKLQCFSYIQYELQLCSASIFREEDCQRRLGSETVENALKARWRPKHVTYEFVLISFFSLFFIALLLKKNSSL